MTETALSRDELAMADERGRYRVQPEWIGLATLINVGLLVLCIYLVSSLIGVAATDAAYRIAIVSLVLAMPLLAFISILTEVQRARRYASYPWYMILAQSVAQGAAVLGFGAAVWRAWWPASIALVVSGVSGLLVFQAYYRRLEKDNEPDPKHRRGRKAEPTHGEDGG
jgi:hypothetical protein